jgi:hypothetical protein
LKLKAIGASATEKALQVNLDESIYGSFAEIGAGQEVSRTFLQAGAAAGTVAKSLSAYDMQMSDALYGSAKRYVTEERLIQMMQGEYNDLEALIREGKAAWGGKGPNVRFFSFASTLAAKAFMSDRECEGWVGVQYQHEAGAEPSMVAMHVRMSDPTATEQGEAIGKLGTNLIYLISKTNDPYVITTFLEDGIAEGRLEVDYMDFTGPAFPEGLIDMRLISMRMVQYRLTPSVLLEPDPKTGKYRQVVPNNAMYKTPVIVQRSRFLPVTKSHQEVMESARRQVIADAGEGDRAPKSVFTMQVDDLVLPPRIADQGSRIRRLQKFVDADTDRDGHLSLDQLRAVLSANNKLSSEDIDSIVTDLDTLDPENLGFVEIDALQSLSTNSAVAMTFLDRFDMLEPLGESILISSINRNDKLAEYLSRYTNQQLTIVIGGGGYSLEKGLYNPDQYTDVKGGMLEALGRLFKENVKVYQYPTINRDGTIVSEDNPSGSAGLLHQFFLSQGNLLPIAEEYMSPGALDKASNEAFTGGSSEIKASIKAGTSEWETYVPAAVAKILNNKGWFKRVAEGKPSPSTYVFRFLENTSA